MTVAAAGVLNNDTDVEHDPLTAVLVSGPTHGTLSLNSDGSFAYTPAANFNGTDSFTYHANDGALDSAITTVAITVTAETHFGWEGGVWRLGFGYGLDETETPFA